MALAAGLFASSDRNGATQSLLSAHGFSASLVAGLVNRGLVTIAYERVRAGGGTVDAGKVRITESEREALRAGRRVGRGTPAPVMPLLHLASRLQ